MRLPRASVPLVLTAVAFAAVAVPAGCGGGGDVNFTAGSTGGSGGRGPTTSVSSSGGSPTASVSASSTGSTGGSTSASTTSSTAATTSSTAGTGSGGGVNPTPISSGAQSFVESETSVAATPGGVVAAAWIAIQNGGGSTNGYRFSSDGGHTWGPLQQVASPGGRVASDPVLAVDQQNNFYMSWVGFQYDTQGNPFDMHVYVSVAPAGQTTFGAPVEVTQGVQSTDSFDKPWVTVTNKNTVIVTYAKTSTGGIYSARSTNQGATWTNTVIVEDGNFRNLVYPCPPLSGNRIWATYHAGGGIGLRWSDDDGVSWPDANKSAAAANGEQPAFDDPTCASAGNEVWVAYGLTNDGGNTAANSPKLYSIRLTHSPDGGQTFDYHIDAHDTAAGMYFMHPQLIRDSSGELDLTYYSGNSDGDTSGAFRRSRSTDGQTWQPSTVVLQPVTYLSARSSQQWLGDYTGVYVRGGTLFMSFVTNSSGTAHIDFASALVP